MLIVKIHYGLGNQLFQYAFAKSLSLQKGVPFSLDIHFYKQHRQDQDHPRLYQLNKFCVDENIISDDQVTSFIDSGFLGKRTNSLENLIKPYYSRRIVYERSLSYDPNILLVNDGVYLAGYWQDLRYFQEHEEVIRRDLRFKHEPVGKNLELRNKISSVDSVGIHIRRGDYLTDRYTTEEVGIADLTYYRKSIEDIRQKIVKPSYFVFTDDPKWVEDHFDVGIDFELIIENNQESAFEDLRLLSCCRNHIISNSSFGWWGAWLANHPDGNIFAPAIWRKNGPDMYTPKNWSRV